MIYHLVTETEYARSEGGGSFLPANFREHGFTHCALEAAVIPVANDYYSNTADTLLLLQIEPEKLKSETKYEPAKPGKGAGTAHVGAAVVFPHVYGPIDDGAVVGVGVLRKEATGYVWPREFVSLADYRGSRK